MLRKACIDAPGALHHIIVRRIDRRKIFFDNTDRDDFLDRLGGILLDSKTACLLNLFGGKIAEARRGYLEFVKKGVALAQARFNRRRVGAERRRMVRIHSHAQSREQDEGG